LVAVTGATGHLGTVLVKQLVERGDRVRYLARSGPTAGLAGLDAESVPGDLTDRRALARLVSGVDVVFHCAARISIIPGDWVALQRTNVEGTRAVLEAARAAGVRRFVDVASIEAFPLDNLVRPVTEEQAIDPGRTAIEYGTSKALAVEEVLAASGDGIECVVCAPTSFIGPPDYRRSPLGQVISDYLHRKLPAMVDGGFDFVDVRDVADGVIKAGDNGKPGRIYLLSGRFATIPELMSILESVSGVPSPRLCLPQWLIRPFTPAIELYYRVSGRPPQFTRSSLKLLRLNVTVDSSRARDELGFASRPLEETLADTAEWLRTERID